MREMFKRAKRVYGYKRIPFLAVFEKTKRGEPHLHILARCKWIDQRWLSRQMDALIDAPIVDIRRVTSARQMVNYVTKYIGKDPTAFKGCKRYWSSRDWRLPTPQDQLAEELPAATFEVFRGDLEAAATHLRTQHYWVVEQDKTLMAIEWAYYARGPTK